MESCIRIGHDPENGEFYVEAYGLDSEHLGSRHFKRWYDVILFLGSETEVVLWLRKISKGEMTNAEAERKVSQWHRNG